MKSRIVVLLLGLIISSGCNGGADDQFRVQSGNSSNLPVSQEITVDEPVPENEEPEEISQNQNASSTILNNPQKTIPSFTIASDLCDDDQGPVCTDLRLGDDYLTTSSPAKGYLYSCSDKNPNAPGSREDRITWIDFKAKTWNFLMKLWLPGGSFNPNKGTYNETVFEDIRNIEFNNLPVDGQIGDWPMTDYPTLTQIDGNPGIPASQEISISYPLAGKVVSLPSCVGLGAIGVTRNGVLLFNAADARGEDAVAREIVDKFGGHPAMENYHYHFIPERLDNEFYENGHSGIVGYINDGFPIHGYKGEDGYEMSNKDLDLCHGHDHGILGYHYHATLEYPYTVGCYRGNPAENSFGTSLPPRR